MSTSKIATYRLQFREGMGFREAAELVPYLAKLGISHLYASPILRARAGSTHGYDGADPRELDPALGGEEGFAELAAILQRHGMGLLVDIVPNHLGVGSDNPFWQDLLRWGEDGPGAPFFDIDWQSRAGGIPGRLLLPVLGKPYGEALAAGELELRLQSDPPDIAIGYFDNTFPTDPRTWASILDGQVPEELLSQVKRSMPTEFSSVQHELAAAWPTELSIDKQALHTLHEAQAYRLTWWRAGNDNLNWRRFFDITELAGLKVEQQAIFDATHGKILELVKSGTADGLRIDHVDGLADPTRYLHELDDAWRQSGAPNAPWILVEKIMGPGEDLPTDWPVAGTTGYEVLNEILGLFVDPAGKDALDEIYERNGGDSRGFAGEVRAAKRMILEQNLAAETTRIVGRLSDRAAADLIARDLPERALREAVIAVVTELPVYRTYGSGRVPVGPDRQRLEAAVASALQHAVAPDDEAIRYFSRVLFDEGSQEAGLLQLRSAFEQLTGPAMAKAVEDTAFYRWYRLTALNEVGGEADHFGRSPEELHDFFGARADRWPEALLATATHDTKRGEDTRLRIAALSEFATEWGEAVDDWRTSNLDRGREVDGERVPGTQVEYLFYQTLVGALTLTDGKPGDIAERLVVYLRKALREAKQKTSWLRPNEEYEAAIAEFVQAVVGDSAFLERARAFADRLSPTAAVHGLAQTLIKLTAPGIPDIYQGTERWDLSLVDPDNRRPVDYELRRKALDERADIANLLARWRDGRIKQRLMAKVLGERRKHPRLWTHGDYRPLEITGPAADRLFAFARTDGEAAAITLVPRLVRPLLREGNGLELEPGGLADCVLHLPPELAAQAWRSVFRADLVPAENTLRVDAALSTWPVALFVTA